MIESYIEDGNQSIGNGVYGQSITDPCLGDGTNLLLCFTAWQIIYRNV